MPQLSENTAQIAADTDSNHNSNDALHDLCRLNQAVLYLINTSDFEEGLKAALIEIAELTASEGIYLMEFKPNSKNIGGHTVRTYKSYLKKEGQWIDYSSKVNEYVIAARKEDHFINHWTNTKSYNILKKDIPQSFQDVEKLEGIAIMCVLPVFLDNWLWGLLGFGSHNVDRQWKSAQVDLVGTFTHTLCNFLARKKVESELQSQRDYLRNIIDIFPGYIFSKTVDGRYKMANEAIAKAYGTTLDQVIGSTDLELNPNMSANMEIIELQSAAVETRGLTQIPQFKFMLPNGEYQYLHAVKYPVINEAGEVEELLGIALDVTSQKEAELRIKEEQLLNESIAATIPDYIMVYDVVDNKILYLNRPIEFYEMDVDELENLYEHYQSLIHPQDVERATTTVRAKLENASDHEVIDTEYRLKHLDGKWNWYFERVKVFRRDEQGQVVKILIVLQDIQAKKEAEDALRKSEARLEQVITGANLGTWEWDIKAGKIKVNSYWCEMLGYNHDDCRGNLDPIVFLNLLHPDEINRVWKTIRYHLFEKTDFFEMEFRMKTKSGGWKWIYDRGRVVEWDEKGDPVRATGTHMDITERRLADQAIKESETLFRTLYEESPLGIALADKDGKIIRANAMYCEMLGFEEELLIGKDLLDGEDEDALPYSIDVLKLQRLERIESCQLEKKYVNKNNKIVWANLFMSFITDAKGRLKFILAMVEDISEKRKTLQALEKSKAFQLAAISVLPDLKFRVTKGGRFIDYFISKKDIQDMVVPPEQFLGKKIEEILGERIGNEAMKHLATAIQHKKVTSFEYNLTVNNISKYYEARFCAIGEDEALIVVRNVTDQKKAQEQLQAKLQELDVKNRQLQKYIDSNMQLENFAYIASHDLREPLRTMANFAQLLSRKYEKVLDAPAKEYVNFIVNGSRNMNQLIEDLLAYSRVNTDEHVVEPVALKRMVFQVLHELNNFISQNRATIHYDNIPETISGNRTKLKQLFQNLISNAIKFHRPDVAPVVHIEAENLNSHWKFAVRDNGIGIEEDYYDKIFLLFKKLHNKKQFQGTGIGLALCKKIVEQHHGSIWLESVPGEGTTFYFTIRKPKE